MRDHYPALTSLAGLLRVARLLVAVLGTLAGLGIAGGILGVAGLLAVGRGRLRSP